MQGQNAFIVPHTYTIVISHERASSPLFQLTQTMSDEVIGLCPGCHDHLTVLPTLPDMHA